MKYLIKLIVRVTNAVFFISFSLFARSVTYLRLIANDVIVGNHFRSFGIPVIDVEKGGKLIIGDNCRFNNGRFYNRIGRQQSCYFIVLKNATLAIGSCVGISSTAIVCSDHITIDDYVKIGGNTVIYDTDFHSIETAVRNIPTKDEAHVSSKPIRIKKSAFIGAHTTILKGITIGENSVIGAGSVVTKDIPDNEVWGGNPCKFIKKLNN